jgi:hypothetical protein
VHSTPSLAIVEKHLALLEKSIADFRAAAREHLQQQRLSDPSFAIALFEIDKCASNMILLTHIATAGGQAVEQERLASDGTPWMQPRPEEAN